MGMLRVLLALVVILNHSAETHFYIMGNDGGLAVMLFFVISGFYMALIANKYRLDSQKITAIKNFYLSRFLRIYPVYWICSLAALVLAFFDIYKPLHMPYEVLRSFPHIQDKIFYIFENIFIFGQDIGRLLDYDNIKQALVFDPLKTVTSVPQKWGSGYPLLGQTWTLALELTFYLLVPFILTKSVRFIALLCSTSLILRLLISFTHWGNYNVQHTFFPVILGIFLLGSLAHRIIYKNLKFMNMKLIKYLAWLSLAIILVFSMKIYPIYSYSGITRDWIFVCIITLSIPFLFNYFKDSKIDNWIGEFSFPLYMTHLLFIGIAKHYIYPGLFTIGSSFIASVCLIYLVIKPIDLYRHRYLLKQRANESGEGLDKYDQSQNPSNVPLMPQVAG